MNKKPETNFKEKFFKRLDKLKHCWYYKTQEVSRRGIPDIIMCLRGYFIAIELKKDDKEKPEALQEYVLKKISKAMGSSMVCCPENFEKTFEWLEYRDKEGIISSS